MLFRMLAALFRRRQTSSAARQAYAHARARNWRLAVDCARAAASAKADDAEASFVLGWTLIQLARQMHAEAAQRVGSAFPQVEALYKEAISALERTERHATTALAFKATLERGIALREAGDLDAAHTAFQAACRLCPDDSRARRELAASSHSLGDNEGAIAAYKAVIDSDPADAVAHAELGQCLLSEGQFARGWDEYESRLRAPDPAAARIFPFPGWRGEPLGGRTLLVRSEQGVGDEIMFASCLPDVIAASGHCVVECSRRLAPLFRRSFPQASVLARNLSSVPDWDSVPAIDLQVMAGSLPRRFRRRIEDFPGHPYLSPDPAAVAAWRVRLGEGSRDRLIGLAWTGGLPATLRAARSMALPQLAPLLSVPGARFVSLELFDLHEEIATLRERHGVRIVAFSGLGGDLDDLAAAVASLDLVITAPTAVAHVAGALGKPVWVLVPRVATWRYLRSGERMPWYSSARVLRRPVDCSIESFIAQTRRALEAFLAA